MTFTFAKLLYSILIDDLENVLSLFTFQIIRFGLRHDISKYIFNAYFLSSRLDVQYALNKKFIKKMKK